MKTIEIKNINGDVIFKHTAEDNTITLTVEAAVSCGVSLANANLSWAILTGADLEGANLEGADLSWAHLEGANLEDANLEDANLAWANLEDANLKGAILKGAKLEGADLSWANLEGADLTNANLEYAILYSANLDGSFITGANLTDANLKDANLKGANLKDANLKDADLKGANLKGAILKGAILEGANLERVILDMSYLVGAQNIPYIPLSCPSEGAFVAWKKVGKYLVKLQIPEDARRLSATARKCRCDKAIVLDITSLDGNEHFEEVTNTKYNKTIYKVGEMVYPDSFDENRWCECSHGIHFFINKEDAINY